MRPARSIASIAVTYRSDVNVRSRHLTLGARRWDPAHGLHRRRRQAETAGVRRWKEGVGLAGTPGRSLFQSSNLSSSNSPRSGLAPSISRSSFAHSDGRAFDRLGNISLLQLFLHFFVDWTHNFSLPLCRSANSASVRIGSDLNFLTACRTAKFSVFPRKVSTDHRSLFSQDRCFLLSFNFGLQA